MDNRPVLFLDSGIGGLPYCQHFHRNNPRESLVYVADREYFPYGSRERPALVRRLEGLFDALLRRWDPKLAVLACNTATVSALAELRERFPRLPLVGTVPAVKPAVRQSKKRHIGVLGTSRTVEDPYIARLAAEFGPDCAITAIAAPDLVDFVERRFAASAAAERRDAALPYIDRFRSAGADAIVLGCTHFLFLLDAFRGAAEDLSFHDSLEGVSRRAESLLDQGDLRSAASPGGENLLLITGSAPPEPAWQEWARSFGLTLLHGQGLC
ncbi:MAG: glutamate racemase [Treponema sp.]|jgi:glutamate racemase|nr:glutamate racemase [Treponema sp.]